MAYIVPWEREEEKKKSTYVVPWEREGATKLKEKDNKITTLDEADKKEATRMYSQYADARKDESKKESSYNPIDTAKTSISDNVDIVKNMGTSLAKGYTNTNVGLNQFIKEQLENIGLGASKAQETYFENADDKQTKRIESIGDVEGPLKYVYAATESLPLMATFALNPVAGTITTGASAYGNKAKELEDLGASQTKQQLGGLASGSAEAGFSAITAGAASRVLRGSGSLKDFVREMFGEVVEETTQSYLDPRINNALVDDYQMPSMEEQNSNAIDSALTAFTSVLMTFGIGSAVSSVRNSSSIALANPTKENVETAINNLSEDPNAESQFQKEKLMLYALESLGEKSDTSMVGIIDNTVNDPDMIYEITALLDNKGYTAKAASLLEVGLASNSQTAIDAYSKIKSGKSPKFGWVKDIQVELSEKNITVPTTEKESESFMKSLMVIANKARSFDTSATTTIDTDTSLDSLYTELIDEAGKVLPENTEKVKEYLQNYETKEELQAAIEQVKELQNDDPVITRVNELLGDLETTKKADAYPKYEMVNGQPESQAHKGGKEGYEKTPRVTSPTIEKIMNMPEAPKYEAIKKALENIKKGKETKWTKIIKDIIDNDLQQGYYSFEGSFINPNNSTDPYNLDIKVNEDILANEGGYLDLRDKKKTETSEYTGYEDAELEEQHKKAVIKPESILTKAQEGIQELAHSFTRSYMKINPNVSNNAEFIKEMNLYKKSKSMSGDNVSRKLMSILKDLDSKEYDVFSRHVLLADLNQDATDGLTLPGLYTPENVKHELSRLDEFTNDKVKASLEQRATVMNEVKENYIESMKKIGYDASNKLEKENYFRHIVMDYYGAKNMTQTNSSQVKGKDNRGFTKQRTGTEKLIVEDYLQAEYEILLQLTHDANVAKIIDNINTKYGIKDKLQKQVRVENKEIRATNEKTLLEVIKDNDQQTLLYNGIKKNLGIGLSTIQQQAKKGNLDHYGKDKVKAFLNDGDFSILNSILSDETLEDDNQLNISARTVFKYMAEKKVFQQNVLGEQFIKSKTWKDVVPEGYKAFQPIDGKRFVGVNTISSDLADALLQENLEFLTNSNIKINEMLAIAGNKLEFVLPNEMADTMNDVYEDMNKKDNIVSSVFAKAQGAWKRWVLTGNPHQVVKYNIRNVSGDLDGLIAAGGAKSLTYTKKATKDLYAAIRKGNFTSEMKEWYDRGGYQDLLYANEIQEVQNMKMFKNFRHIDETSLVTKMRNKIPIAKTYLDFTEGLTNYRESILRYAAYINYKDVINKNGGKVDNYGASKKSIIDGLDSVEDKAYQLSKDALGAYDEISASGQKLRKYLIPFYSWTEVNFKRYKRVIENDLYSISDMEGFGEKFGKSLGMTGKVTGKTAYTVGKLGFKLGLMSAVLTSFNHMVFPDEEKDLPLDVQKIPHIVLGRDQKGNVVYFSRLGASTDLLEWFGLDTLWYDIQDIANDKKSLGEQANDMIYSPINKVVSSVSPFIKIPIEVLNKKTYYPDVRNPSTIRDTGYYFFNTFGLREEYKRLAGLPVNESYVESWAKAFVYKSNPEVSAYYDALDWKYQFRDKVLGETSAGGIDTSEKSKALYYLKQSIKYGDMEKAKKFYNVYMANGGSEKGLKTSLTHLDPLYGLDEEESQLFYYWLNEEEREKVLKAIEYYNDLLE